MARTRPMFRFSGPVHTYENGDRLWARVKSGEDVVFSLGDCVAINRPGADKRIKHPGGEPAGYQYARVHKLMSAGDEMVSNKDRSKIYVQWFCRRSDFERSVYEARQIRRFELVLSDEFAWVPFSQYAEVVKIPMFVSSKSFARDNPRTYHCRRLVFGGRRYIRALAGGHDAAWQLLAHDSDDLKLGTDASLPLIRARDEADSGSDSPRDETPTQQTVDLAEEEESSQDEKLEYPSVRRSGRKRPRKSYKLSSSEDNDDDEVEDSPEPRQKNAPRPHGTPFTPTAADALRFLLSEAGYDLAQVWKNEKVRGLLWRAVATRDHDDRVKAREIAKDLFKSNGVRGIVDARVGSDGGGLELVQYICLTEM